MNLRSGMIAVAVATSAVILGCNIFDPLDNPSGDAQILSAARACFDQGDLACARENYLKLSTAYSEIQAAELAFVTFEENGATMSAFMETISQGGSGTALTSLAERMAPGSEAKRLALTTAVKNAVAGITTNTELRGLVRFLGGVAVAAEVLAEEVGTSGTLLKSALASANVIQDGSGFGETVVSGTFTGNPTLTMFHAGLRELDAGLTDLSAGSSFNSGIGGLLDLVATGNAALYRAALTDTAALNIGR